jgi:hypothetical protein
MATGIILSLGIWGILLTFGNFVVIWNIFSLFGKLYQEKSGNPDD